MILPGSLAGNQQAKQTRTDQDEEGGTVTASRRQADTFSGVSSIVAMSSAAMASAAIAPLTSSMVSPPAPGGSRQSTALADSNRPLKDH
jgi:hypothetical protein